MELLWWSGLIFDKSDGYSHIEQISDKYYEFDDQLHKDLISLRGVIKI